MSAWRCPSRWSRSAFDAEPEALFNRAVLEESLLEKALAAPIEEWMTWLHPDQVRLVRRSYNGPCRVRGAAGTGKTVVGLHRAAYLAASRPGRLLYVSYVRTLPVVLGALYRRLAPSTAERVEFTGLHRWAQAFLRDRGIRLHVDAAAATAAFDRAWAEVGERSVLHSSALGKDYWRQEVDCVLKGRGLTGYEQYAGLNRVGRRTPLQPEQRRAVWGLYAAYDAALRAAGVHDFNDLLAVARDEVRARPLDEPYAAVIADEVQDLNCVGVELLHALVGDKPDGLTLVGDGQQAVYPGGFTLAEAGVSVAGRGAVLRVNYRNTVQILEHALSVVAQDGFDDLDGAEERGARDCEVRRLGPPPRVVRADSVRDLSFPFLTDLRATLARPDVQPGDVAVLAASRRTVSEWRGRVEAAGIATVGLDEYDGTTTAAVKVGTFKRAKGLEFTYAFLPQLRRAVSPQRTDEEESAYRERLEREHRELFVGMTRARDGLWLGYVDGWAR